MEEQETVVPGAIEAEKRLLGSLMTHPHVFDMIMGRIVCEDFCSKRHRVIYTGICELANKGVFSSPTVLGMWLESQGILGDTGGHSYLEHLAENPVPNDGAVLCSETVKDSSVLHELAAAAKEVLDDIENFNVGNTGHFLAVVEQRVASIADRSTRGLIGLISIGHSLRDAYQRLLVGQSVDGGITGLATGYTELDEMTAGLQPTDLIIVGGRPAMGKTSFALNIVEHVAIKSKKAVAFFSMEMPASQLSMRLISSLGRISTTRLRNGQLDDEGWRRVTTAIKTLRDARIFIDDTPTLTPEKLHFSARRLKHEQGLDLIVIDYLQMMRVTGVDEGSALELAELTRSIKALARQLNVPVIALSSLNRSLERRVDKRPILVDLRGSGALEDDADTIMFIYRDDYYRAESPDKGFAEILVAKQRNGPTGTVKLKFTGEHLRFDNLSEGAIGTFE